MKQNLLYRGVRVLKLAFVSRKIPKFIFLFILTGFFVVPLRSLGSKQFTSSISKNKLFFYEKTIFKGAYFPKKRQQITTKGKVLAEDKQPISGANVMIKGRGQGTKTDKPYYKKT